MGVQLEAEEETSLANSYLDDYVHDLAETYSMPTPDEFSQIYGDLEEDDDDSDSDSDDDDDDSSSTDDEAAAPAKAAPAKAAAAKAAAGAAKPADPKKVAEVVAKTA